MPSAVMHPPRNTSTVTAPGPATSSPTSTASSAANTVSPTVVSSSHLRRSTRSAMAPPTGDSKPMGTNAAAATSPVHLAWPVTSVTKTPTATVCIHEPMLETSAAPHTRAKFRWRRGRSDGVGHDSGSV